MADFRGGFQVFNHKRHNVASARELLSKVDLMVEKNGAGYYTSEMFQEAFCGDTERNEDNPERKRRGDTETDDGL